MLTDWSERAELDPYHAVLSSRGVGGWEGDLDAFFDTGEQTLVDILDPFLEKRHIDPSKATVIEWGCGVGRITNALLDRFQVIRAIDVAPEMLKLAFQNVYERSGSKAHRVDFALTDGFSLPDSINDGRASMVFSVATLQHIPSVFKQLELIKSMVSWVKPGGLVLVQVHGDVNTTRHIQREWERRRQANDLMGWAEDAKEELGRYETWACTALPSNSILRLAGVGRDFWTVRGKYTDDWWIGGRRMKDHAESY